MLFGPECATFDCLFLPVDANTRDDLGCIECEIAEVVVGEDDERVFESYRPNRKLPFEAGSALLLSQSAIFPTCITIFVSFGLITKLFQHEYIFVFWLHDTFSALRVLYLSSGAAGSVKCHRTLFSLRAQKSRLKRFSTSHEVV